jgi:cytoskeleton protein RodZ
VFEIGDTLREARSRKGLTLRDVEDATKIRSRYLQALENDDFEVIPGPAFVKGFLRTYASFLGLDADLLVNEYRSRFEHSSESQKLLTTRPQSPRTRSARRRPATLLVALLAIVVILVLAWIGWGNRTGDKAEMNPSITTTTEAAGDTTSSSESEATTTSTSSTTLSVATTIGADGAKVTLVIVAAADRCFLTVKEGGADGQTLYSGTLDKGQQVSFNNKVRFWLNIGKPSALQVSINGATVTVPEPYGNFQVTSAGLTRLQ